MNANTKNSTDLNGSSGFGGKMCAGRLLTELWQRQASTLTNEQLKSVADGVDYAASDLILLSCVVSNVASLVSTDHFDTTRIRSGAMDNCSEFLFLVANQIETLTTMIEIGSEADFLLNRRSPSVTSAKSTSTNEVTSHEQTTTSKRQI